MLFRHRKGNVGQDRNVQFGNGRPRTLARAARPAQPLAQAGGVAVFRGGLKKGVFTTVAGARCRTASTVISICSGVPSAVWEPSTVASAIIRFSTGDHVVEVALPTCWLLRYTGTATRDAVAATAGARPAAS